MTRPLIVVGTPCYGGVVTQEYAMSVLNLSAAAPSMGIEVAVLMLGNDALITRGRSTIVSKFMDNETTTHLLFVDADITFNPRHVARLLSFDKDFVAGIYPAKVLDWEQMSSRQQKTPERMEEAGLAYVGDICRGADAQTIDHFATGVYAGTGFQLIKRAVFERMFNAYPELNYKSLHAFPRPTQPSPNLFALFDCMIDPDTGVYLSEDYAFCRRWRALGGQIWLDLESKLVHTGPYAFRGNAEARFIA